jgi:glycerophosphoryl diester phosphodiesterase
MALRILCLSLALYATGPALAAPIVIAHRGASGYLPEHTLAAAALAQGQGADYIEQDVVLSRDGTPVLLHDVHLDAVSNVADVFPGRHRDDGRFYALDFTLDELRELRIHERRGGKSGRQAHPGRFPTTAEVPFQISTLDEHLAFLAGLARSTGRRLGVYTEIKDSAWHKRQMYDPSAVVIATLRRHGYATKADACFVQSFDADEVRRIRFELGWEGRLVQLLNDRPKDTKVDPLLAAGALADMAKTVDGVGIPIARVVDGSGRPNGLVAAAHAAGLVVHAYTFRADALPPFADSAEEALQILFVDARIDGLFSDFPDICTAWLREHTPALSP